MLLPAPGPNQAARNYQPKVSGPRTNTLSKDRLTSQILLQFAQPRYKLISRKTILVDPV